MHSPHNCELDFIDAAKGNELPPAKVAEAIGICERQVRRKSESARRKLSKSERADRLRKLMMEK